MLSFFTTLLGGVFLGARTLHSTIAEDSYTSNMNRWRERCDAFNAKGRASSFEEREMKDYISSGRYTDEIYKKLQNELIAVFGSDYKSKFPLPDVTRRRYVEPYERAEEWALHLLLSQRGLVGPFQASSGFLIGGYKTYMTDIKICKQIERNLQKKHPEVKLVMTPSFSYFDPSVHNIVYKWDKWGSTIMLEHAVTPKSPKMNIW